MGANGKVGIPYIFELCCLHHQDKEGMSTSHNLSEHQDCVCLSLVKKVSSCKFLATALEVGALRCDVGTSSELTTIGSLWFKQADDPQGTLSHSFSAIALA